MNSIPEPKLVYTATEVSHLLGIGRNLVYEGVRRRQIPSVKIGRRLLIPRWALERLLSGDSISQSPED